MRESVPGRGQSQGAGCRRDALAMAGPEHLKRRGRRGRLLPQIITPGRKGLFEDFVTDYRWEKGLLGSPKPCVTGLE